ncbi:beta-ketoacyl synthase N-terminal-like domain-containing protein [Nocardia pseudovaccinii]|uniref:beta-ketoacyl synthase N-terminal-like domain-containing protein n=1 Tax=Nocardia pseudovaccinii TaxID=189540 RepID=UPI003D8B8E05
MRPEPIAVVGRGCVLPGAFDPDLFWDNVSAGQINLTHVAPGRRRLPSSSPACSPDADGSDIGGYVEGFDSAYRSALTEQAFREIIDPTAVPRASLGGAGLDALDPLFRWIVYAAAAALRESGRSRSRTRAGLVLGNLSYPSTGLASFAEQIWLADQDRGVRDRLGRSSGGQRAGAADRFMSGLPAHLAARILRLGLGGFALDAACASSLYAIKLACDALIDRRADLMLAGGANRADELFLRDAFDALSARSRSGRSMPFHRQADGLVPGEGATFVALMRLADAIAADAPILGVIRAVGLSNDGRDSGLLAPSKDGQARAMRAAYAAAGVPPETVGLLECHATGTPLGDLTEVRSSSRIFAGAQDLAVGSVKANVGHLLTAAGGAGLLKVLGALRAGVRPASPSVDDPLPELIGSPLRLLTEPADWAGPRRAAVSAFGFGGANAHLVIDAWTGDDASAVAPPPRPRAEPASAAAPTPIAVVAVQVAAADDLAGDDLWRTVMSGTSRIAARSTIAVDNDGLCFPPIDLAQAHAQQLLVLQTARDAVAGIELSADRTTVLIGMGCDPEVARPVLHRRIAAYPDLRDDTAEPSGDRTGMVHTPASVVGSMPNLVANRINAQLGLTGPGFTISAEEGSGLVALQLAVRSLRAGESDAAVVGAVDLSREKVHQAALAELGLSDTPGDAAVVVVLERLANARAAGRRVLAILDDAVDVMAAPPVDAVLPDLTVGDATAVTAGTVHLDPSALFGRAHAASGLLAFAVATLAAAHHAAPQSGSPAVPLPDPPVVEAGVLTLGGTPARVRLRAADPVAFLTSPVRTATMYSGRDRAEVADALAAGRTSADGPARLVVLAADAEERTVREAAASRWLESGGRRPDGVVLRERPITGDMAFVFSGGSMAYPGMGRELMLAFPDLLDTIRGRCGPLAGLVGWAHDPRDPRPRNALHQVWGAAVLAQLHAEITTTVLGLRPDAAIGYSSGELSALAALGAWPDITGLTALSDADPDAFGRAVADELAIVQAAWREAGIEGGAWQTHLVDASADRIRAALVGEPAVHLMVINAPDSCVIGGEASACARVLARLDGVPHLPIPYDIPAHVPELAAARPEWKQLYRLPTNAHTGVRHYTCSTSLPFELSVDTVADAVTRQQLGPIDFAATIERAWADGVRIFIEHGPRGLCSAWIRRTLGSREHMVVTLDAPDGRDVDALQRAAAELLAAGVPLDIDALAIRMQTSAPTNRPEVGQYLNFPARCPKVQVRTTTAAPGPSTTASPVGASSVAASSWGPATSAPGEVVLGDSTTSVRIADRSAASALGDLQVMEPAPVRADAPARAACRDGAAAAEHWHESTSPEPLQRRLQHESSPSAIGAGPAMTTIADHHRTRSDALGGLIAEQVRLAGEAHRSWLVQFMETYQEFLDTRRRGAELLMGAVQAEVNRGDDENVGSATARLPVTETEGHPRQMSSSIRHELPVTRAVTERPGSSPVGMLLPTRSTPCGPAFDRAQLEALASSSIAAVLGADYVGLDDYPRVIRMPSPPLLLADRVTGIDAVPGGLDSGVIWTETDVPLDVWYLDPAGRMPAGIAAEAGQASLLLLTWLGADHLAQGARVYRLLGCEVTFHGELPRPGETLRYQIHIDGREPFGAIPLFRFHSECFVGDELRLTITQGRAGLFTDAELADGRGLSWRPDEVAPSPGGVVDPPAITCGRRAFTAEEVAAFADGRPADCFGTGWELTRSHVRTPRIAAGRGGLLHEVPVFDPEGGPWGRGYLRGELFVTAQDWFFAAHFPGDPCMPGTLMSEGCFQAMAFYLAAAGFTVGRDGWRFEPVTGTPFPMQYRGQVLPTSSGMIYEVFVVELIAGPQPTLIADVLCTVDGIKACHGRRLGLRLVPDWPLIHWQQLTPPDLQRTGAPVALERLAGLSGHTDATLAARAGNFAFDYKALLGCAWGKPSEAFGPPYAAFDSHRHIARLPAPPFHFMSRVTELEGQAWELRPGSGAVVEYDVPAEVWYFEQNDYPVTPLAVVMEVALQASGWLAAYVGSALNSETDLHFRNLGGTAMIDAEIHPGDLVVTRTRLTNVVDDGRTIIEDFATECLIDGVRVVTLTTTFGFFPADAFTDQVGIPATPEESRWRTLDSAFAADLTSRPDRWFGSAPRLPGPMLTMIDRITGYWPDGGAAGLGRLRAVKDVDPGEWFFKAHFFQDPVQPGSLGVQALCQLIQFYVVEAGLSAGLRRPRFRLAVRGQPLIWKYRGQVTPLTRTVTLEVEIVEITADDAGPWVVAEGWLWADDVRIYHVPRFTVGLTEADDYLSGDVS